MAILTLNEWYQIDFAVQGTPKNTMNNIIKLVSRLKQNGVLEKWFYLYEGATVRIRFKSSNQDGLRTKIEEISKELGLNSHPDHPFEPYAEASETFNNSDAVETFANIMAELSELMSKKTEGKLDFSNYTVVERLSHCIFNTVYGSDTEIYFLLKRLGVDFQSKDNPEQTALDSNQQYSSTSSLAFSIPSVKVPTK